MGGDGISDISSGAGEGVGGMVNGADLTLGSIARLGANGSGSTVGADTRVDNELVTMNSLPEMLVCHCHTQTTRLHPRPHPPPI